MFFVGFIFSSVFIVSSRPKIPATDFFWCFFLPQSVCRSSESASAAPLASAARRLKRYGGKIIFSDWRGNFTKHRVSSYASATWLSVALAVLLECGPFGRDLRMIKPLKNQRILRQGTEEASCRVCRATGWAWNSEGSEISDAQLVQFLG